MLHNDSFKYLKNVVRRPERHKQPHLVKREVQCRDAGFFLSCGGGVNTAQSIVTLVPLLGLIPQVGVWDGDEGHL